MYQVIHTFLGLISNWEDGLVMVVTCHSGYDPDSIYKDC